MNCRQGPHELASMAIHACRRGNGGSGRSDRTGQHTNCARPSTGTRLKLTTTDTNPNGCRVVRVGNMSLHTAGPPTSNPAPHPDKGRRCPNGGPSHVRCKSRHPGAVNPVSISIGAKTKSIASSGATAVISMTIAPQGCHPVVKERAEWPLTEQALRCMPLTSPPPRCKSKA